MKSEMSDAVDMIIAAFCHTQCHDCFMLNECTSLPYAVS